MPVCWKCGKLAASSELRRTTKVIDPQFFESETSATGEAMIWKQAWACKDSHSCKARRKWAKKKA